MRGKRMEDEWKTKSAQGPSGEDEEEGKRGYGLLRILGRITVFLVLVGIVYWGVRTLSYVIFGPELEVVRGIAPDESLAAGAPVTLGVVVRNRGLMEGAAFVVAALGEGVEVEGPTLDVPAKDTALIPVRVTLPSGERELSLVVFDGWRGVRRLTTLRGIPVSVRPQEIRASDIAMPEVATRGEHITVSFPWTNLGRVEETLVPVVVFRPAGGGPPVAAEGKPLEVSPQRRADVRFTVDTWRLSPGRYSAQILVRSQAGHRVGRGSDRLVLNVRES